MRNWHITIIARDVNGNWSEYDFDNIDEFRDAHHKKISQIDPHGRR